MKSKFRKSSDPKQSALSLLEECSELRVLWKSGEGESFRVAFASRFAEKIVGESDVGELFIDSTCKTNSSRMELFGVVGSFLGRGLQLRIC